MAHKAQKSVGFACVAHCIHGFLATLFCAIGVNPSANVDCWDFTNTAHIENLGISVTTYDNALWFQFHYYAEAHDILYVTLELYIIIIHELDVENQWLVARDIDH